MSEERAPYTVHPAQLLRGHADTLTLPMPPGLEVPDPLTDRAVEMQLRIRYASGHTIHTVTWRRDEAGGWQPLVKGVQP